MVGPPEFLAMNAGITPSALKWMPQAAAISMRGYVLNLKPDGDVL